MLNKIITWLNDFFKDRNFMKLIHITENLVSKVLSIALIIVIFVSIFDLILVLSQDLFVQEPVGFFNVTLIEIFGFFLNVLIALELLENITVYIRKHVVQLELVLTTALIAVARKIIIFDTSKYDKVDLIALGFATLCLALSYGIICYIHKRKV
ncbi:phosphate-starvation-inducible PsiE family protein [Cyanobacterium aponinum FACHB-4101]|uniref:phosphate-starvation-inducible PsiE family protein n=1 Tax=Cyanobacterium aponinum TaxID=379064 RepID=UPI00167FED5C|nr:phosphate-starvation-inducible PsiE family protein [Cyanobacterium aponinum]MBD2394851.1 phosphate-starvation-inducible PsiE family protein [Cyanobacterium aponinum FACHB-4101]